MTNYSYQYNFTNEFCLLNFCIYTIIFFLKNLCFLININLHNYIFHNLQLLNSIINGILYIFSFYII